MNATITNEERELEKLYTYSRRHLPWKWLRKAGFENVASKGGYYFFRVYLFSVALSAITFILSIFGDILPDKTILMQIYTLFALFAAWFGGFRAGVICTLLMTVQMYIFFYNTYFIPHFPLNPHIQILLFFLRGVLVSWLIDAARQTGAIMRMQDRERQYARSLVDLKDKYDKAQEEIMRRDEFLSIASHELKTPLSTMLMKLHDMLNTVRSVSLANFSVQQLMEVLENAEYQIRRVNMMINDLLNVSFITTGRLTLQREETDLIALTKTVIDHFREQLAEHNYKLTFDYNKTVVGMWDPSRIEQAVINLISNAIKYGNGNPITINVTRKGGTAYFIIKDRGVGIHKKEVKLLFGLFNRAHDGNGMSSGKSGLGVGLFVTNRIVKAHGGRISLASSGLRGTIFTITLPLKATADR